MLRVSMTLAAMIGATASAQAATVVPTGQRSTQAKDLLWRDLGTRA